MNNKKTDKIMIWEGFKKELPWILFWILLGVMTFGYYQDKKICDEVLANPCDICYGLNETLMDMDYLNYYHEVSFISDKNITPIISVPYKDKNPNARSISSLE